MILHSRVVLYSNDLEPITIIELSHQAQQFLLKQHHLVLPVWEMLRIEEASFEGTVDALDSVAVKTVDIVADPLRGTFKGKLETHMLLRTGDEETAMLLKSAFLPGQQSEVHEQREDAFARGFIHALNQLE